jgi:hypothetical protein
VGKIGLNGSPFLVGSHCEHRAESSGRLYFSMNDEASWFGDNCGEVVVKVAGSDGFVPHGGSK